GVATLLFLPMMFLMGMSALQASAIRRVLMVANALIAFCFVLPQGFIIWSFALASLVGCYIGGYIGTKIALRKGDQFVKYALATVMISSGIVLLAQ
ncbi:MAG TPA: TSUP family transporter, partial [Candidatus Saccharimonadales bacterium]|nr:TSUP family transporter [Candidatus Saccharimonadales bacterium]